MKTTVKKLEDTKIQVTITLLSDELADAKKVATLKLSKDVKVPGFRKGKVPLSVAEKHINPATLDEQLINDAISKSVADAFIKEDIRALDRPQVDIKKYVPDELLEFTAEAEVLPKIKLGNYKNLGVKPTKVTVLDSEVDEAVDRIRQNLAIKKPVTRNAKLDDEVLIDFVGKKDGVAFDGGTGNDYTLKLGSGQFIPGFEEGIVGHKTGDVFDLKLKFPKDYHAKDLAGKEVVFTTTLKEINELELPDVDDKFAEKAGPFKTVGLMKADLKAQIEARKQSDATSKFKDELIEKLIEGADIPAPEVLVSDQMRSIEQDFAQNLLYRGLDIKSYLDANNFKDEEDWKNKELKPAAIKRVKAGIALAEVTKQENIVADEKEIDEHVELHKKQYGNNPDVLKHLNTPEGRRDIANHYVSEKTIEHLTKLNS